jgi:hypothetical protein
MMTEAERLETLLRIQTLLVEAETATKEGRHDEASALVPEMMRLAELAGVKLPKPPEEWLEETGGSLDDYKRHINFPKPYLVK